MKNTRTTEFDNLDKLIEDELTETEKKDKLSSGTYVASGTKGTSGTSGAILVDWNEFPMNDLADYLESKWMFQSSGEAFAIMKMIDFYREHNEK